ncbi:carbohydrate ABC transporter ATP-binding protein, CUT1 family (TC 3.A.1.1.-) [Desulfuromusa kysingii]|uniref:Carbohydrate ABC transporter ATP-binding protein, CUT1 family (TC 3.A.1.1.-) n=1 Tax=Desulfuromusa kysingii TaxID=37625 RepID=A0A1H4APC2_9BACT|nr:sn-glycerol-3-phosphate ABC transporter ATP-binding protein UgpC [Desulfuromusa kysingii]SEA37780.1 carbohydrate ABC transporter ATP-binding protein, CUT1 family (TC 3.A.1.1.-) [Desulfuromusa kysingii]
MANVILKDVFKNYGKLEVVHGINLNVAHKEFVVLVGPSGCGKSTALRMIAGLEDITAGTIEIGDRVVNDVAPKDRDAAMVFQNYALYPHMNVYKNMSFGLKLRKMPKDEIEKRVREAADILELEDYLFRKPHELSGGQRQRVAMGRAIVRRPAVYLFDEPLSNLDAKLRTQMRLEIKLLHHNVQNTIIYVTHDQVEAMTLADRIVVMRDGYIEQVGSPIEIFQHPANAFVAGFIGSPPMNLLSAVIINSGDKQKLKLGEHLEIPIPARENTQFTDGQKVIMGLRTEDIHVTIADKQERKGPTCSANGIVKIVEPLGNETNIHMDVDGADLIARADGRHIFTAGEELELTLDLTHLHIFDAESEKSIY